MLTFAKPIIHEQIIIYRSGRLIYIRLHFLSYSGIFLKIKVKSIETFSSWIFGDSSSLGTKIYITYFFDSFLKNPIKIDWNFFSRENARTTYALLNYKRHYLFSQDIKKYWTLEKLNKIDYKNFFERSNFLMKRITRTWCIPNEILK